MRVRRGCGEGTSGTPVLPDAAVTSRRPWATPRRLSRRSMIPSTRSYRSGGAGAPGQASSLLDRLEACHHRSCIVRVIVSLRHPHRPEIFPHFPPPPEGREPGVRAPVAAKIGYATATMALYHFSEDPTITRFVPRPPLARPEVEPLVWAIDDWHAPVYFLPRDCPRVCFWPLPTTTAEDYARFFATVSGRMVIAIESGWLERLRTTRLYRYRDAGGDLRGHPRSRRPCQPRDRSCRCGSSRSAICSRR